MLHGRTKLISELTVEDLTSWGGVVTLINSVMMNHLQNKQEIDYLIDYKNGIQPILNKAKTVRPEINNKLVINHAQMITRTITGYFLGTPIQYVQASPNKRDQIELLNKIVAYEDKPTVDKELAEYQSICGTAYRIIYTDKGLYDDVPFEDRVLNPSTTFVVYKNDISEKALAGVTYLDIYNTSGQMIGRKFYIYTDFGMYYSETDDSGIPQLDDLFTFEPYSIGGVPIIEYPNNIWRIGDWELCIDVMNAINTLDSSRLDDIEQIVQNLIIFVNADIDEKTYDEMRLAGLVCLKNTTNLKTEVMSLSSKLDQSSTNTLAEELSELVYAIIGIPNRNKRSGGGGDTGTAVELRDGWAELEIVARNKEFTFKRSEKQALKIMLTILNAKQGTTLELMDIVIKFSRNKNNNLLVKTQAYMNLIHSKTLDPSDCLTIVDLVSDVNDFIDRGRSFWGDDFAGKLPENQEITENSQIVEDNSPQ